MLDCAVITPSFGIAMASRFLPGSTAYAKNGRSYTVEIVDGGTVYCTADNGTETEFPEANLFTEVEWGTRSDGRRDISYSRLKQARAYSALPEKLNPTDAEKLLTKAERVLPSLLDYVAYTVAERILIENRDQDQIPELSIVKCRQLFDETKPEARACLLAVILGTKAEMLISALKLGDNLIRAMLEKGLATHKTAFEDFLDRPRR
jgi:hypothetical protein